MVEITICDYGENCRKTYEFRNVSKEKMDQILGILENKPVSLNGYAYQTWVTQNGSVAVPCQQSPTVTCNVDQGTKTSE